MNTLGRRTFVQIQARPVPGCTMSTEHFDFPTAPPPVRFEWAGDTAVGKIRLINEDCYAGRDGLFVVADGMGGHQAGDVASQIVVGRFMATIGQTPVSFCDLEQVVTTANADVRDEAISSGRYGMGATVVALVWVVHRGSPYLAVVSVGDSRCYLTDDDGFRCVTHDHSLVQDLVDRGVISSKEARTHPDRNVVTRAMGVDEDVVADYVLLPARGRQRLLLCSDGVSTQLGDDEIMRAMASADTPFTAVREMIDAVMRGKAPDNATAVVVDVGWTHDPFTTISDIDITTPRPAPSDRYTHTPGRGDSERWSPPVVTGPSRQPLITSVPRSADHGSERFGRFQGGGS